MRALTRVKKYVLTALVFLAATVASGSDFTAEVGTYPLARLVVEVPTVALLNYDFLMYSQFSARIDIFPWLYASGSTTAYFYPYSTKVAFYPFFALLMLGAGVRLGPVTIGYEHRMDVAVVPYSFVADPLIKQDSGVDKVFLQYAVHF